jgi:hypothetical protein
MTMSQYHWLHVIYTPKATMFFFHKKTQQEDLTCAGILDDLEGVLSYNGWD